MTYTCMQINSDIPINTRGSSSEDANTEGDEEIYEKRANHIPN